jgi:hypothetical protein
MGGKVVLPPAFQVGLASFRFLVLPLMMFWQYIPSMLASYDWRVRHAGLMAIAAIGEGTGKVSIVLISYFLCSRCGS